MSDEERLNERDFAVILSALGAVFLDSDPGGKHRREIMVVIDKLGLVKAFSRLIERNSLSKKYPVTSDTKH